MNQTRKEKNMFNSLLSQ